MFVNSQDLIGIISLQYVSSGKIVFFLRMNFVYYSIEADWCIYARMRQ